MPKMRKTRKDGYIAFEGTLYCINPGTTASKLPAGSQVFVDYFTDYDRLSIWDMHMNFIGNAEGRNVFDAEHQFYRLERKQETLDRLLREKRGAPSDT